MFETRRNCYFQASSTALRSIESDESTYSITELKFLCPNARISTRTETPRAAICVAKLLLPVWLEHPKFPDFK